MSREDRDLALEMIRMLEAGKLKMGYPTVLDKWIAMRETDKQKLKALVGWDVDRDYKVDPLAERISTAFADFLWSDEPSITAADENDQDNLDAIVDENQLPAELHSAEEIKASESQVWWRIYTDPDQADVPIIEWHSRTEVIPWWRGRKLLAVAFISVVGEEGDIGTSSYSVWRRLEVYGNGVTYNVLFKGNDGNELGARIPLTEHPETREMKEEWLHELPMLAGVVSQKRGRSRKYGDLGRSVYDGIEDFLLELNATHSVDSENFKLAGKKRAIMPRKYAKADGSFDAGEEIFFTESMDEMEDDNTFKILEYTHDSQDTEVRLAALERRALTRAGLAQQWVDANANEGLASGTALRTRLIPTTLAAEGQAKPWDEALPQEVLVLAQQVDALDEARGGFGRPWAAAGEAPAVERGSILPEDRKEELDYHVAAVGADLESMQTGVAALHPDWTEEQVKEEVKKILAENAAAAGFSDPFAQDTSTTDSTDPNAVTPASAEDPTVGEADQLGFGGQDFGA